MNSARVEWVQAREDPARARLPAHAPPSLDAVRGLFPRLQGTPAFDPELIQANVERLHTVPAVNTGHPLLDHAIKTGLAHIDATFQGDHPQYGVNYYAKTQHDGFPPVIIATVDALTAWGLHARAAQLFRYWLVNFVRDDGTLRYYGPSLSEYGQLLHTAALLHERAGPDGWWTDGQGPLGRVADHLRQLCARAAQDDDLIPGIPEADVSLADPNNISDAGHNERNRYFHNSAWIARGLARWADLLRRADPRAAPAAAEVAREAIQLGDRTVRLIRQTWPADPAAWWLPPQLEPAPAPASLTANLYASYTNYRYWPELLSSGLLPPDLATRVVEARLTAGGQFCGTTRFGDHLDDWPLADYLTGLWALGRRNDFLLSLYGHLAYHQAEGHLTAYEQVSLPPGKELANYCLPCQLVVSRAGRRLIAD